MRHSSLAHKAPGGREVGYWQLETYVGSESQASEFEPDATDKEYARKLEGAQKQYEQAPTST